jgi:hypothetical protein
MAPAVAVSEFVPRQRGVSLWGNGSGMWQGYGANLLARKSAGAELTALYLGQLGIDPADMVDMAGGNVPDYDLHLRRPLEFRGRYQYSGDYHGNLDHGTLPSLGITMGDQNNPEQHRPLCRIPHRTDRPGCAALS